MQDDLQIESITRVDAWMRRLIMAGGLVCLALFVFLFGFLFLQALPLLNSIEIGESTRIELPETLGEQRAFFADQNPNEAFWVGERQVWRFSADGGKSLVWETPASDLEIFSAAHLPAASLLWLGLSDGQLIQIGLSELVGAVPQVLYTAQSPIVAMDSAAFGERQVIAFAEGTSGAAGSEALEPERSGTRMRTIEWRARGDSEPLILDLGESTERVVDVDLSSDVRYVSARTSEGGSMIWMVDQTRGFEVSMGGKGSAATGSQGFGFDAGSRILIHGASADGFLGGLLNEGSWEDKSWNFEELQSADEHVWTWRASQQSAASILFSANRWAIVNLSLGEVLDQGRSETPILDARMTGRNGGVWRLHSDGLFFSPFERAFLDFSFSALFKAERRDGMAGDLWQPAAGLREIQGHYSLIPIFIGTLWGTFLSVFVAFPFSLLAAVYTSQIARSEFVRRAKPLIELVGAVPSVVLGVVCAFWISPKIEGYLTEALLFVAYCSIILLLVVQFRPRLVLWIPSNPGRQGELFWIVGVGVLVSALTLITAPWVDAALLAFFDVGDNAGLVEWLELVLGVPYEQRNALSIALVLGFTTTPFMYSLMDDALSQVPAEQIQTSLSLGASRIQTVINIVLPAAMPGLLGALLISGGRCIGETMIFVMASGNTPTTSMSLFEGFRTVSATLVIELSESSQQSTLYRVLFVAALGLLCVTFVFNTAAAILREGYLRRFDRKGARGG